MSAEAANPQEAKPLRRISEVFTVGPAPGKEAAVYYLEDYGRRILPVTRTKAGSIQDPKVKNCLNGRTIRPALTGATVARGDLEGYAQICRLCAFEAERLDWTPVAGAVK